jgi:hypothetical protein
MSWSVKHWLAPQQGRGLISPCDQSIRVPLPHVAAATLVSLNHANVTVTHKIGSLCHAGTETFAPEGEQSRIAPLSKVAFQVTLHCRQRSAELPLGHVGATNNLIITFGMLSFTHGMYTIFSMPGVAAVLASTVEQCSLLPLRWGAGLMAMLLW